MKKLTDPSEIVTEFQKRQKRIVMLGCACFVAMIPIVLYVRSFNPIYALYVMAGFIIPFAAFYFYTFRCPACGALVSQRRRLNRMAIVCRTCQVVLDPKD